jgi:copper(I)-binding protein
MVPAMNDLLRQTASRLAPTIALIACIVLSSAPTARTWADATAGTAPATGAKPTVQVLAAWIRWLPAGLPRAGYLTLVNTGDKALRLVSVSSPSYGEASLHRTVTHGDVEDMVPVRELTLEPHKTLEFETTGYHIMLMQPTALADSSSRTTLVLRFSDGSVLTVPFEVRKSDSGGSAMINFTTRIFSHA